jgi:hypothetical protein
LSLLLVDAATAADRAGRWEGTIQIIGNLSEDSNGDNGSGVDIDSDVGFGAGVAYNFNDHFAAGFDLNYLSPDYDATLILDGGGSVSVSQELDVFSGMFSGTWNILPGQFTPFVELAAGWTYVDSNIADGRPTTGCWWDPWWGYICAEFYDTYDDTTFTWGAGAGLRLEFDQMFVKGGYSRVELDTDGADPSFDLWKIELGWLL